LAVAPGKTHGAVKPGNITSGLAWAIVVTNNAKQGGILGRNARKNAGGWQGPGNANCLALFAHQSIGISHRPIHPTRNSPPNLGRPKENRHGNGLKPGGSNSAKTRMEPDFFKIL